MSDRGIGASASFIPASTEHLQNIQCEQALLSAIFVKPDVLHDVTGFIEAEDFYEPLHAEIFTLIKRLAGEDRSFSPISLLPFFQDAEPIGELSVPQYLGKLMASVVSTANARDYARTIREYANRRRLSLLGVRLTQTAGILTASPSEIASETVTELDGIISASRKKGHSTGSLAASTRHLVETLKKGDVEKPITTGLHDLNKVVGGWRRGEYAIIAARPSMGKSAFAASTMVSIGMSGHGVLMFSLEMTQAALAARCLSEQVYNNQTPIRYADILNNRIQDWDRERLERAAENFTDVPIEIDDQAGLTVSEIASRARKFAARLEKQGRRLDVVMVDHLGKVKASKRYSGNIVAETGEVSAALAGLAKELGVAMIALHQLNRAVEGREDKHPTLPDLRNSGDIEQDADTIGFLYRPAYYLERSKLDDAELDAARLRTLERRKHELEIIIAKNRNGPCTTIDFFIDVASNLIRDKA